MTILCLHHNDSDGRASGAIVRYALGSQVQLFEIDYGEPVPWERIQVAERVIIVDYSLSILEMQRIAADHELIWIDHHISWLYIAMDHTTLPAAMGETPSLVRSRP